MAGTTTVTVERDFAHSQARVFDAWLDLKSAAQWLFATPDGRLMKAALDPREGGTFLFVERRQAGDAEHYGRYLRIARPDRLIFEFGLTEDLSDATSVTVEVEDHGENARVVLSHEGVPADYEAQTQAGWRGVLNGLARSLGED